MRNWSPSLLMLGATLAVVVGMALALYLVLSQPWLGLDLATDPQSGEIRIVAVDPDGPARAAPIPGVLTAIGPVSRGDTSRPSFFALEPQDLIEEPDVIETYDGIARFMGRQGSLAEILAGERVRLDVSDDLGLARIIELTPGRRPLGDLPASFWVQIVTGLGGLLIGAWVFALKPADWGARMLAVTGFGLMVSAFCAAIYSSREIAIDPGLFNVLSALNHFGALLFGAAMVALFLSYPRPIARPPVVVLILASILPLLVIDLLRWAPGPALGHYLAILLEMLAIIGLIGVQWRLARGDPRARAALRWLGLSVIVGAGAFVVMVAVPILMTGNAGLEQGYAFGFFLLIYAGLALGLRRYRLFDLDEWAFRVLFYTGGALALVGLDAILILALNWDPGPSLGLSLLAIGFLYLPFRDALWRRMMARRRLEDHEVFRAVIAVAFHNSQAERAAGWRNLVARLFDPLEIRVVEAPVSEPERREEGLGLVLPATGDSPPLLLRYPWQGHGLIGTAHLQLARQLTALMAHAESSRSAYVRGVDEERRRIAQDLHDDVGARLLSGLHKPDVAQARRSLREALADIRTIVSGLAGERLPLDQVLADLRHETSQRLEAAGIALDWPLAAADDDVLLEYRVYKSVTSALREIVSNVIRHAGAKEVRVRIELRPGDLKLAVSDDGIGLPAEAADGRSGNGLGNISRRVAECGGTVAFLPSPRGTTVAVNLPLPPAAAPELAVT